jgi:hypothetical protein
MAFGIAGCFGRGNLFEIPIHDREREVIAIQIGLDRELLSIAQCLLGILEPVTDRAHQAFTAQPSGDSRNHLLSLAVLSLGGFILNSMNISFKLNEKITDSLFNITRGRH